MRGREGADGHEMEFIVRSLVELKLQVEELRRRTDHIISAAAGPPRIVGDWVGEVQPGLASGQPHYSAAAIEPPGSPPPPNTLTVHPGMTMAEIERSAIEAALRETSGNRRKAADMLGIGERTLYRKLREYQVAS